MSEGFIGFMIWLLSSYFCLFNPASNFGKKVIFCSWILGPCKLLSLLLFNPSVPILGMFSGMTILGTVGAIVLAYIFGERVIDRLNPNASRIKYIVIGFLSSVLFSALAAWLIYCVIDALKRNEDHADISIMFTRDLIAARNRRFTKEQIYKHIISSFDKVDEDAENIFLRLRVA